MWRESEKNREKRIEGKKEKREVTKIQKRGRRWRKHSEGVPEKN